MPTGMDLFSHSVTSALPPTYSGLGLGEWDVGTAAGAAAAPPAYLSAASSLWAAAPNSTGTSGNSKKPSKAQQQTLKIAPGAGPPLYARLAATWATGQGRAVTPSKHHPSGSPQPAGKSPSRHALSSTSATGKQTKAQNHLSLSGTKRGRDTVGADAAAGVPFDSTSGKPSSSKRPRAPDFDAEAVIAASRVSLSAGKAHAKPSAASSQKKKKKISSPPRAPVSADVQDRRATADAASRSVTSASAALDHNHHEPSQSNCIIM
jgi:hypothetical protein